MRALSTVPAVVLLASMGSCGDTLVGADYLGEPLFVLRGNVQLNQLDPAEDLPEGDLRLALFWNPDESESGSNPVDNIEQQGVTAGHFPAQYEISLYTPPPKAALTKRPGVGGGKLAVGSLIVYIDANGNEVWDGGKSAERIVGGSIDKVIAYAGSDVAGEPVGGKLGAGYHVMFVGFDRPCFQSADEGNLVYMVPADGKPVDLQLGAIPTAFLIDVDCDDATSEWCSLCPDLATLETLCAADNDTWSCDLLELCRLC